MQQIYIPQALKVNNEVPAFELQDGETYYSTAWLDRGIIKKPSGISVFYDFGSDAVILGAEVINSTEMLVFVQEGAAGLESTNVYVWNMQQGSTLAMTLIDAAYEPTYEWYFDTFFTETINGSAQTNLITVCTNGVDIMMYYEHGHPELGLQELTTDLKALFPAHFWKSLYLGYLTEDVVTAAENQYGIAWSDIGDAGSFALAGTSAYYSAIRNEAGTSIKAMKVVNNLLYCCKTDQIWSLAPYDNFTCLTTERGVGSQKSIIASNTLIFNDNNNKIYDIAGNWYSKDIDTLFTVSCMIQSPYGQEISSQRQKLWSAGKHIFINDEINGGWQLRKFDKKIKLLGKIQPGDRTASQWINPPADHNIIGLGREEAMSDYIIQYGD